MPSAVSNKEAHQLTTQGRFQTFLLRNKTVSLSLFFLYLRRRHLRRNTTNNNHNIINTIIMVDLCSIDRTKKDVIRDGCSTTAEECRPSAPSPPAPADLHYSLDRQQAVPAATHRVDPEMLYRIPCIPVHCGFGVVQVKPESTLPLRNMIQKERRSVGGKLTVLFAIRRPGCGACREHGRQLTELDQLERDVSFVGAIKEIGVNDQALLDFYQQYFRFPIVLDKKWEIFKAMGGRQIGLWPALTSYIRLNRRYKSQGIPNVQGGDIWTQGGVLVFDKDGNLRHTYYDTYGELLDVNVLRAAIREARTPLPRRPESSSAE
jgi:AhpC/TSA antioxidant enzyme